MTDTRRIQINIQPMSPGGEREQLRDALGLPIDDQRPPRKGIA